MSYSVFIDRNDIPDETMIYRILGKRQIDWQSITQYMTDIGNVKAKYKYYGKNYGWALGFSKSNRSIISLYPNSNEFYVQVILNKMQENAVLDQVPNVALRKIISEKKPIHEGKWIFAEFALFSDIDELKHLIEIRLDPHLR